MAFVIEKPTAVFDMEQITCGVLIWAKHITWNQGKAGFVTSAANHQLIVQYHPGIGNVTNHFVIPVSEAVEGQWEIRWSADLLEVQEYPTVANKESQETEELERKLSDAVGRIDL